MRSYITIAAPGVDIYSASNTGGHKPVDAPVTHPSFCPVLLAAGGAGAVFGPACWAGVFSLFRRPASCHTQRAPGS
ncbi:hypothetical protein ABZ815_24260 [Nonomuraea sp. NPDC047529]|uniref:hypothetical protein n=1 Tax=unclassified Nonomuraea TaxID=2593643 RepID=UPI0033DC95E9